MNSVQVSFLELRLFGLLIVVTDGSDLVDCDTVTGDTTGSFVKHLVMNRFN